MRARLKDACKQAVTIRIEVPSTRPCFSKLHCDGICAVQGYEAAAQQTTNVAIIRQLGQYLLPKDNAEYKARIAAALALLVASKGLNVSVRLPCPHTLLLSSPSHDACHQAGK